MYVLFFMNRVSMVPYNKQALHRLNQDSLTILEKDGSLRQAIETGSTEDIENFINALPNQICAEINLIDSNRYIVKTTVRAGCPDEKESVFERRAFIANNFNVYYARMETWYNVTFQGGTI